MAQARGGDSGARGTPGGAPSASPAPSSGTISSAPVISSSPSSSRDYSGMRSLSHSSNATSYGGGYGYVPNLTYSSFYSVGNYYQWYDFCYFLQTHYYMNPSYFSRFTRQSEPLVTPELLKLTMREPMKLSYQMLEAIDSLEALMKEGEAGKPVDKAAVSAKTQEIRDLAKRIRTDQALMYFDQRRDKEPLKVEKLDSPEAIGRLREVATDLSTQLKGMYTQTSTSTVSVQSLAAPSFESLAKGIDKLAKSIENSARHM